MPERDAPPVALTVVSYNIRGGRDMDGLPALDRQVQVLRSMDADLMAIQEVDRHWSRSGNLDQAAVLAENLGLHCCFAPNLLGPWKPGERPFEYGLAILSRAPFSEAAGVALPGRPGEEPRGFAQVLVEINGSPLLFVNTHFGLDPLERMRQTVFLRDWLAGRNQPVILAGDFNMIRGSEEYRLLTESLRDLTAGEGLGTFPSDRPLSQIDFVFASPGISKVGVRVLNTLDSDHLPLAAQVRL